jgi:hydrogenase maturation factor
MRNSISVVRDAMIALKVGGVSAMHDPTEGGLLQGVWEIAEASKVGFVIHQSRIPIRNETIHICNSLNIDPLRLMSSGCLLIAAEKPKGMMIVNRLRRYGIQAAIIGSFTNRRRVRELILRDGSHLEIRANERDELYKVIEAYKQ